MHSNLPNTHPRGDTAKTSERRLVLLNFSSRCLFASNLPHQDLFLLSLPGSPTPSEFGQQSKHASRELVYGHNKLDWTELAPGLLKPDTQRKIITRAFVLVTRIWDRGGIYAFRDLISAYKSLFPKPLFTISDFCTHRLSFSVPILVENGKRP